ncbi:MAG: enoyl-CoA hydratase-related protein [Sandaracinus sp.]
MITLPIEIEDKGPVRVVTLKRPEKKNAFDVALTEALWSALEAASEEPSVRVVVVTGHGDYFTAGADVNLFLGSIQGDISRVARLYEPLRACKKPTIAAINGPTVGMGVTMLPSFDMVYAAEHATFMVPFMRLALGVEYGGSFHLTRLIGHQRTRELILRGKPIDAATASTWGLVTRVFPKATFMDEVMSVANDVAAQPPGAVLACRRVLDKGLEIGFEQSLLEENAVLATRYGSEENVAAVMAFLTRKKG